MAFLGFRQGTIKNNYRGPGTDPRNRAAMYFRQQAQMNAAGGNGLGVAPPQRGSAQPPPGTGSISGALAESMGFAPDDQDPTQFAVSPVADSLDALNAAAMQQQRGPVYIPGFQAPQRRVFSARRGYRGQLNPGDQINVHDGEVVMTDQPTNVAVVPKSRVQRGIDFSNKHLSGAATIGQEGSDQFDAIQSGAIRPDQATSPAARRAGHELYASGQNPIRDRMRQRFQPTQEQLRRGQDFISTRRKVGESDADFNARMQGMNLGEADPAFANEVAGQKFIARKDQSPQARAARRLELNQERKSHGLPTLEEKAAKQKSVREALRQRQLERRESVQEFGTARPMAIGALRERKRVRGMQEQMVQAQTLQATANALKASSGGKSFDLSKIMSTPDGVMNFGLLLGMVKQDPSMLPILDQISPELRLAIEEQMAAQAANPPKSDTPQPTAGLGAGAGRATRGALDAASALDPHKLGWNFLMGLTGR